MVKPLSDIPEWAHSEHIGNGETCYCAHCQKYDDEDVVVTVTDTNRLATWMGVNWEDGFVETVACPQCGYTGQIKTKLLNKSTEQTKLVKNGVAAVPRPEADSETRI